MRITFCGAAGMVTGSCYLFETNQYRFIVDCGMYQGNKEIRDLNRRDFLFNPAALDFALLTHAHVDHSGLIPKLWKSGFQNPIYTTRATAELAGIVLPDSGHIQEMEAEWRSRKKTRAGEAPEAPLYTAGDALDCLHLFKKINYQEEFQPVPGVLVKFLDAGHIMGSAIIEITVVEDGKPIKVVCSGDLGQKDQPIIQDPTYLRQADYLLIETTYGNRLHDDQAEKGELLAKWINEAVRNGGNLVIPAFAVGRTQDLLYYIRTLLLNGKIPRLPVYIDSPMAVSVTEIYRNNPGYYDEPTMQMLINGGSPFEFNNLHFIKTAEESRRLNETAKGAVIISASGMCEAGRILHHLKHNLWRPESHVLFVGYQAEGTLGRRLLEGAKIVKVMGEEITVKASIHNIPGFSAHGDQHDLLDWLSGFTEKPKTVFLIHGEKAAQQEFAAKVKQQFQLETVIPKWGESFELNARVHRIDQIQPELRSFDLDRTVTDLEHSVLNLQNQVRQADLAESRKQLAEVKRLVLEFEELLNQNKNI